METFAHFFAFSGILVSSFCVSFKKPGNIEIWLKCTFEYKLITCAFFYSKTIASECHFSPLFIHTHTHTHTLSIAFRHLPPNSARFSYATEGALFISAQLSSDAVSASERFGY